MRQAAFLTQCAPHSPLFSPVGFGRDCSDVSFSDPVAATLDGRQGEQLFLDVRGKMQ